MSSLLLYRDITLLNRERHKDLKLKPEQGFRFAAETHYVPLAAQEFYQAARDYPILFVGDDESTGPIALLGLEAGRNQYVSEDGRWQNSAYVPAFVRRYPFVLADIEQNRVSVCFDSAFDGWNEEEGQALFDEEGNNTPFLDEVIEFLRGFRGEMERTRRFVDRLRELGLLEKKSLNLRRPTGETFRVNDFLAVDEKRFGELEDDQILSLHREGFLGLIYAHLMSLGTANRLFDQTMASRLAERAAEDESGSEEESAGAESGSTVH